MALFFDKYAGKKVALIGAGVSHKELIILFAKAGAQVTLCDKKEAEDFDKKYLQELKKNNVTLCLGEDYLQGLAGQDIILRTPGFEFFTPQLQDAKKAGIEISSEMELFFENCPCSIVAVTGSDGKTTTTSLIAAMYEADGRKVHLGGNIGRALLPIVDTIDKNDIAVVELSSFQLISMKQSPHIAVVTNVTPNHLDHHKDMEEYVSAKLNILMHQKKSDIAILGYENVISRGMEKEVLGECRFFSRLRDLENGAFLSEDDMLCIAENGKITPIIHKKDIKLRGVHNIENLLTAFSAVRNEVSVESMRKVAETFQGVEHRIEPVRTVNGVQWFNDSIASSPTRVMAGLRSFDQKLILIAGGYDKKVPYAPMAPDVIERVKVMVLMGQTAHFIEAAVRAEDGFEESGLVILRAKDMADAVRLAQNAAQEGDIVTLSPASASFDAYPNFEARGKHYKELVMAL